MSHLNTPQFTDEKSVVKYDPKEYRKLWVRKNFWFLVAGLSTIAWGWMLITMLAAGNMLGVIAVAVLAGGVWLTVMKSNRAHVDAFSIEKDRRYVRRANKFVAHELKVENVTWPDGTSYVIEAVSFGDSSHKLLSLMPRDTNLEPLIFEVTPTSVISPRDADFSIVLPKLESMATRSHDYAVFASTDGFMKTLFKPKEYAGFEPFTEDSPTSLRGD